MEEEKIILERHEGRLNTLERDVLDLKSVQIELWSMNEALVTLATELKHANEHLSKQEERIGQIENVPRQRWNQIVTAIVSALAGGFVSALIGMMIA